MSDIILVTLPIGNLKDITQRALEALQDGEVFYAEDTRVFKELLHKYGISLDGKFIDSFHDQSVGKIDQIMEKIRSGKDVYIVSDAGSPMISDPAYPLQQRALLEGVEVKTLPGATAVTTALELSCLPPIPFHFWGFLLRGKSEKKESFKKLSGQNGTHIFFESPHRIFDTIEIFFEVYPEDELVICRELTKTYESVYRLKKEDLKNVKEIVVEKGEFVILFNLKNKETHSSDMLEVKELAADYLEHGGSPKKLAKILSKILNKETKVIYEQLSRRE